MKNLVLKHTGRDGGFHYFLKVDDVPVSYAKVYENYKNHVVALCDIETREGFRNHGYAGMLLNMIADKYDVHKVYHGGGFTEDGYHHLQKYLDRTDAEPAKISFEKMDFVEDWDNELPKYI